MLSGPSLRRATLGLGVGTLAFGLYPLVFPRRFGATFGLPLADSPAAEVVIRSVSARDVVSGIGLLSAVLHGGRVGPWLLGRALSDGADAVAIALAWLRGARQPRLAFLGFLAVGATVVDLALYRAYRSPAAITSSLLGERPGEPGGP